jgi:putative transposase
VHVHVVFVTTCRRGVPDDPMPRRRQQLMREVRADAGAEPAELTGDHDHVHLLVEHPPKASSTLVNPLNGVSSKRLRQDHTGRANRASMHRRFWSPS